jgi:hypothetical protein
MCGECPICKRPTEADELWDYGGLCARCGTEQTEVIIENRTIEKEEEEDE